MAYTAVLSRNFSWEEACITQHRGIDNTIPDSLKSAVQNTAFNMERVRALLNTPIVINSWYRCRALNIAVGSNPDTTQHAKGEAVDFISPAFGTPLAICQKIIKQLPLIDWDQLIYEHTWVHISWNSVPGGKQRNQVLTLLNSGKYATGLCQRDGTPIGVI